MNRFETHQVFNQAPPFGDVNLFGCDLALESEAAAASENRANQRQTDARLG